MTGDAGGYDVVTAIQQFETAGVAMDKVVLEHLPTPGPGAMSQLATASGINRTVMRQRLQEVSKKEITITKI